jgi:hypothetical protein
VSASVIVACLFVAAIAAAASYWAANHKKNESSPLIGSSARHGDERRASMLGSASPEPPASALQPAISESSAGALPTVTTKSPSGIAAEGPSELDLLHEARRLQNTDPAGALRAVARHIRLFPHGVLVQERELVALEALVRLGRGAEARARAATFLRLYPESMYTPRLRKLVSQAAPVNSTGLDSETVSPWH